MPCLVSRLSSRLVFIAWAGFGSILGGFLKDFWGFSDISAYSGFLLLLLLSFAFSCFFLLSLAFSRFLLLALLLAFAYFCLLLLAWACSGVLWLALAALAACAFRSIADQVFFSPNHLSLGC